MKTNPMTCGVVFADGYRAGRHGQSFTANPNEIPSSAAAAWLDGWNEGATMLAWFEASHKLDSLPEPPASHEDPIPLRDEKFFLHLVTREIAIKQKTAPPRRTKLKLSRSNRMRASTPQ
jgi:ribosome modulation factor